MWNVLQYWKLILPLRHNVSKWYINVYYLNITRLWGIKYGLMVMAAFFITATAQNFKSAHVRDIAWCAPAEWLPQCIDLSGYLEIQSRSLPISVKSRNGMILERHATDSGASLETISSPTYIITCRPVVWNEHIHPIIMARTGHLYPSRFCCL